MNAVRRWLRANKWGPFIQRGTAISRTHTGGKEHDARRTCWRCLITGVSAVPAATYAVWLIEDEEETG